MHFTLGLYSGKDTAVSLMFPAVQDHQEHCWLQSSHASTSYLLATTSIIHALHRTETLGEKAEKDWLEIMGDFTNHNQVSRAFCVLDTTYRVSLLLLHLYA